MTFSSPPPGGRETHKLQLIGTSYETLVAAPAKLWTLDSVHFANTHNSAVTVTLEIYDGTTATVLVPAKSIAANDVYTFKDHNIQLTISSTGADLLRVKAGTADKVDVTAVGFFGTQTSS